VVAARSLSTTLVLRTITSSSAIFNRTAVSSERMNPALITSEVLDGQVEHDHIDEHVDDVARAGSDPPTCGTSWRTRFCGGCWSRL
jgi:hypothetical protein